MYDERNGSVLGSPVPATPPVLSACSKGTKYQDSELSPKKSKIAVSHHFRIFMTSSYLMFLERFHYYSKSQIAYFAKNFGGGDRTHVRQMNKV